jgi:hypothetical protein
MTTLHEQCFLGRDEAVSVLHSALGLLESVTSLSQQLAGGGEELDISLIKGLMSERGHYFNDLIEFQPTIQVALKVAGQNSSEFQQFSELTKKIRKCDDILVGALQRRKEVVAGHLENAQNTAKLHSYFKEGR